MAPVFTRRPLPVQAERYDGSIVCSEKLIRWVRRENPHNYQVYEEDARLFLYSAVDGTSEIMEGYWLVLDISSGQFEVLDETEFNKTYEKMKEN